MEKIKNFIYTNRLALLVAVLLYTVFIYFSYSGNRICDCQSTEKFQNGETSNHSGHSINRFYHK